MGPEEQRVGRSFLGSRHGVGWLDFLPAIGLQSYLVNEISVRKSKVLVILLWQIQSGRQRTLQKASPALGEEGMGGTRGQRALDPEAAPEASLHIPATVFGMSFSVTPICRSRS